MINLQMNLAKILALILIPANIVSFILANKVLADKNDKGEIVAIVNGENITRTELADFLIDSVEMEGMDLIIKRILVEQEAKKQGVELSKDEVQERIDKLVVFELNKLKNRYGSENEDVFTADLAKMGYDEDKLREKLAERVEIDVRPQLLAEKLIKSTVTVTEEELRAVYEEKYGEKIKLRQIVVKSEEEARELLKKIKAGADFATIAKKESLDRPSAAKGGLIEPVSKSTAFGNAVAKLKEGDLTDVIPSRVGFHILKIEGKEQPAEKKSYEDALPELKKIVMALNIKKRSGPWFLNLIENADIEKFLK